MVKELIATVMRLLLYNGPKAILFPLTIIDLIKFAHYIFYDNETLWYME